jgi:hypothetical protein
MGRLKKVDPSVHEVLHLASIDLPPHGESPASISIVQCDEILCDQMVWERSDIVRSTPIKIQCVDRGESEPQLLVLTDRRGTTYQRHVT